MRDGCRDGIKPRQCQKLTEYRPVFQAQSGSLYLLSLPLDHYLFPLPRPGIQGSPAKPDHVQVR